MADQYVDPSSKPEIASPDGSEIIPAKGLTWGTLTLNKIRSFLSTYFSATNHNHSGTYEPTVNPGTQGQVWTTGPGGTKVWTAPGTPGAHAASHATGSSDPIAPGDIGAATAGHNHNAAYDALGAAASAVSGHESSYSHSAITHTNRAALDLVSGTNTGNETVTSVGAIVNGATAKTAPVDADHLALMDSEDSNKIKKWSWPSIKLALKTYFDTLYAEVAHTHAGLVTNGDAHDHSGGNGGQIAYGSLSGIPSTFTPSAHNHEALKRTITQTSPAFTIGQPVYVDASGVYQLADASADATADVEGVVSVATAGGTFTLTLPGGYITGLSGLTAGTVYFLAEIAGELTATAPTTVGAINKPALKADSATSGYVLGMRGMENSSPLPDVETYIADKNAEPVSIMYTSRPISELIPSGTDITQLQRIRLMGFTHIVHYNAFLTAYKNTPVGGETLLQGETEADINSFLDACHACGLKVFLSLKEFIQEAWRTTSTPAIAQTDMWGTPWPTVTVLGSYNSTAIAATITAFKTHPAVDGWYMDDEAYFAVTCSAVTEYVFDAAARAAMRTSIKSQDTNPAHRIMSVFGPMTATSHPTLSEVSANVYSEASADIIGLDYYPFIKADMSSATDTTTALSNFDTLLSNYTATFPSAKALMIFQGLGNPYDTATNTVDPPAFGYYEMLRIARKYGQTRQGVGWFCWDKFSETTDGDTRTRTGLQKYAAMIAKNSPLIAISADGKQLHLAVSISGSALSMNAVDISTGTEYSLSSSNVIEDDAMPGNYYRIAIVNGVLGTEPI